MVVRVAVPGCPGTRLWVYVFVVVPVVVVVVVVHVPVVVSVAHVDPLPVCGSGRMEPTTPLCAYERTHAPVTCA
ncbi:hypothetical protein SALBM311S_08109 [Streptomyces alboniger]